MFFMWDKDLQLGEELGKTLPNQAQNFEPHSFFGCQSPTKNWVLPLSFMSHSVHPLIAHCLLEKSNIFEDSPVEFLIAFRQTLPKILAVVHIFSFIITTYLKIFSKIKSIGTKKCPSDLSL